VIWVGLFGPSTKEIELLIEEAKEEAERARKEVGHLKERVEKWRKYLYEDYKRFSRELENEKERHVFEMNAVAKALYREGRESLR